MNKTQITKVLTKGIELYMQDKSDYNLDGITHNIPFVESLISNVYRYYREHYKKWGTVDNESLSDCFLSSLKKLKFNVDNKDTKDTIWYHLNFLSAQV